MPIIPRHGKIGSGRGLAFLAILLAGFLPAFAQGGMESTAQSLDLSHWDFRAHPRVEINGDWNFVWGRLLGPGDMNSETLDGLQTRSIPIGKKWNSANSEIDSLDVHGYGTYYLKVTLPENHDQLGISLKPIVSASRVFWGDTEIAHWGNPGASPEQTRSTWYSATVPIPRSENEAYLIVQVANWDDFSPGMQGNPTIGLLADLQNDRDTSIAVTYAVAGLFLIMGVYHVFIYLFRRQERSPLIFAAICFCLLIRILMTDDVYISVLLPPGDIHPILWGSYLSYTFLALLFVFFITNIFRFAINPILRWITSIVCGLYSFVIVFGPPWFFTSVLWIFQLFTIVDGAAMIGVLIAALVQRRTNAVLFLFGFLAVLAATIHDILKTNLQWGTPSLIAPGIVVFVFFQALVLARRSTMAIRTAEGLSFHLQKINSSMARFVPNEFLNFLNRESITDVQLGDHSEEEMAVMFCDIRAFTRISESMSPESTFQLINKFLATVGPIVREHKGFVDKYLGDGVMALFPRSATDALNAALAIVAAMDKVNVERRIEKAESVDIGIGLHYGKLMLGTIGEPQRMDGTVLADAVNLASRLQGLTRLLGGHILVTETTLAHVSHIEDYQYRMLGNFKVYNRKESVGVVEFFDGESPELWKAKRATRRDFERAVHSYQSGDVSSAETMFERLLAVSPEDPAAIYYLDRVRSALSHGGKLPEDG